ncbi:bifunctional phosphopantothenoylcysteine decarboxylase/phosphopantothenate--cysteine ligase CoaBC [Thermodesulfatator autotrophicus]|uniref:Coenzyme A biosynthesis bifunctional protein CoaBC n=1 Tax=Thermodesulfatator autotrophicus TaxID=1795632 RepID=A0A177E4H3_9BACT|nr:bifunctional phosphopantothenoylcysteine decarboxylase/phosphopantothenate--cysteine ligase CoaBC [Thermodesulfatator autotrophicus]OAG26863.1 hypothetical protein TH606_10065 [Thermodesulfatator autotrophicus]
MLLTNKRVLLGVTGGIAAYKAASLLRFLQKRGAICRVVMTEGAEAFISPLTFEALTQEKVFTQKDFLKPQSGFIPHTELARFAEAIAVAPATASFLASLITGDARSNLVATIMASKAPVLICPAMNTNMWKHPAVQENIARLRRWGCEVLIPDEGELACGDIGPGRLPSEEVIAAYLERLMAPKDFSGQKVLVTAGPTREPLDAVRYLSNRSSGKMGLALAKAAWLRGAEVTFIHGPLSVSVPPYFKAVSVETAGEMAELVKKYFPEADMLIMAAAVADYRPKQVFPGKQKKAQKSLTIELEPTEDILATVASSKKPHQLVIGFAAEESEKLLEEARRKLKDKKLDLIVANDISRPETGFETDTNEVWLISASGKEEKVALAPKEEVAWRILDFVVEWLKG